MARSAYPLVSPPPPHRRAGSPPLRAQTKRCPPLCLPPVCPLSAHCLPLSALCVRRIVQQVSIGSKQAHSARLEADCRLKSSVDGHRYIRLETAYTRRFPLGVASFFTVKALKPACLLK